MDQANKKEMWNRDLSQGIVSYDNTIDGYLYAYSESGWTDEIYLGKDPGTAFKAYCEINW